MPRGGEKHVRDNQFQRVTAPTQVLDLIDHVKESEQHDQSGHDERRRDKDLGGDVSAKRPHRARRKIENTMRRR